MRIERCSDSELHCFLSKEDLEARNLRLDALAYGNPETRALIRDLMNWATYKFNFNPDHIPLMIEAVPVAEDSLLIIVKTVSYPEEMDSRFSDFLDSPNGDVYADDGEDYDEEDDDFWPDDEDGYGYGFPAYGPPTPPVPKQGPAAHEIIEQFSDNAQVLKEASDAISKLAEGVLAAAGEIEENNNAAGAIGKADESENAADGGLRNAGKAGGSLNDTPAGIQSAADGGLDAGKTAAGNADISGEKTVNVLPGAPVPGADMETDIGDSVSDGGKDADIPVSGEVVDAAEFGQAADAAEDGMGADEKGTPAITAENFAEVLQKVLEAARKSGSVANYIRMFRFNSIDEIADIASFVASFYRGVNYLYRDGGIYHLLVSMDGESPLNYNKLINILNEFGTPEPVNVETTSFLDEHNNLILADHAIQKLADVAKE